jgi:uncharacterized protein YndB with AHSA1/START domain
MEATKQSEVKSGIRLNITRTFDASPQRCFEAWLDPDQVSKWLGPRAMGQAETKLLEPRVGGRYLIVMHSPNGDNNVSGVYREITRVSKLVFTWAWSADCGCGGAPETGQDAMAGHETLVTVTFRPSGRKTEMTLLHENFPTTNQRDRHDKGWCGSFDQLAELVAGK